MIRVLGGPVGMRARIRARREAMPHVVVEGPVDLQVVRDRFRPLFDRQGQDVLKLESLYLERGGREALLDALVVESGHRQHFFVQVRLRDEGGATVRLLPQTDPEKTAGVKRTIALVAAFVRDLDPGRCRFGATNIGEFLG
jgi:hypothetical protein